MNKRVLLITVGVMVVGLLVLGGCGKKKTPITMPWTVPTTSSTAPLTVSVDQVKIMNFSFEPAEIAIKAGTAVTWTNEDSAMHTVVGTGWESGQLQQGQFYKHAFDTPGTYDYHCSIHLSMTGKVIVK